MSREVAGLINESTVCPLWSLPITVGLLRALPTLPSWRIIGQAEYDSSDPISLRLLLLSVLRASVENFPGISSPQRH